MCVFSYIYIRQARCEHSPKNSSQAEKMPQGTCGTLIAILLPVFYPGWVPDQPWHAGKGLRFPKQDMISFYRDRCGFLLCQWRDCNTSGPKVQVAKPTRMPGMPKCHECQEQRGRHCPPRMLLKRSGTRSPGSFASRTSWGISMASISS